MAVDVENMSADFVDSILLPQASSAPNPQPVPTIQIHAHSITPHQEATSTLSSGQPALPNLDIQHQVHLLPHSVISTAQNIPGRQPTDQHPQPSQQAIAPERPPKTRSIPTSHSGVNSSAAQPSSPTSQASILTSASQPEPFRERVAHLLMDERRFHAPLAVLERVQRFFNGSLQLDPAAFEGSTVKAMISVPFPDIMDTDGWRVPVGFGSNSASAPQSFAPMQSCFLHVPILPSKRRFETETEVIFLDDVRLAGQLNSKLWEEFSNGNVEEAISLVPTSATWFGRTELADWPCVVMSGLKFEQANGMDPSGKKYAEVHSYIAVYLGRDPLRQAQFVRTFQDLGISPPQNPESLMGSSSTVPNASQSNGGQHRWIAGFRRLFRTHTSDPGGPRGLGYGPKGAWHPSHDDADDESIDPQFDDIYSILPPHKKPRLERAGRPSDAQAAWHHSKRRKMEEEGFSKLKDHNLDERKWGREDDMSDIAMDDYTSGSDSDYTKYWIDWFLGTKGNEYFCEVDEEYILDRFNLTGLNTEVQYYSQALDLITDNLDENLDEEMRDIVEKSARHLYGLIHARFIITTHGLTKMVRANVLNDYIAEITFAFDFITNAVLIIHRPLQLYNDAQPQLEKFKKCDFGRCPRVLCHNHPLLPVALSDIPYTKSVKLFCCRCEDIYNPKSTRHASIDGAYFGCSFPHMLFQVYPQLVPPKSTDRYVPRIFGFKLHDVAKQHRYQDMIREESHARIMAGIEGIPTTAAQGSSSTRDGQQNNFKSKAIEGNSSVVESGAMADVNN
ncbi:casein kinase 2 regulatory subunit [Gamsiella multidivaricata]|nr:casein kinase 2 regulatory subunit [Gamsiella multidivaricata]